MVLRIQSNDTRDYKLHGSWGVYVWTIHELITVICTGADFGMHELKNGVLIEVWQRMPFNGNNP